MAEKNHIGRSISHPSLAEVTKTVLGIPASSTPEHLFSIAEKVSRPDRCRLADNCVHLM